MERWHTSWLGLKQFPTELSAFDLDQFFTLDAADQQIVTSRRRSTHRLGIALQIGFIRMTGCTLDAVQIVPATALHHVAAQLHLPAPDIATLRAMYARRRTLYEHQQLARTATSFVELTDAAERVLNGQLRREAEVLFTVERLIESAQLWLYTHQYLIPGHRRLRKLARSAIRYSENALLADIVEHDTAGRREHWVDALCAPSRRSDLSVLEWLQQPPRRHHKRRLGEMLAKREVLIEVGAGELTFSSLSSARRYYYAKRILRRRPSMLKRIREPMRTIEIACFLHHQLRELTDTLLELALHRMNDIRRKAREQAMATASRRLNDYQQLVHDLTSLCDDDDLSVDELRAKLRTLITPYTAKRAPTRSGEIRQALSALWAEVRPFLKTMTQLPLEIDDGHPLASALPLLDDLYRRKVTALPAEINNPFGPCWGTFIDDGDRRASLAGFEAATLVTLQRSLKNGAAHIDQSNAFRNPDELFIPQKTWETQRSQHYRSLQLPRSARTYLKPIRAALKSGLAQLDAAIAEDVVRVEDDRVRLCAPTKTVPPAGLMALRRQLITGIGQTQLPEVLLDVDSATQFSWLLLGRPPRHERELITVYAALLALGSDLTAADIVRMIPVLSAEMVEPVIAKLEHDQVLRDANDAVVRFMRSNKITKYWGPGISVSADMMSLEATRHLWLSRLDPRRRSFAVGTYTHVLDQWGIVYDQPIVLNKRQAGAALEGALSQRHVELSRVAVDTHGFTHAAMALAKLVGFDLCPRLARLADRKLFVPRDVKVPASLEAIIDRNVSWQSIVRNWDPLVRIAASMSSGWCSASLTLDRFGAAAQGNPTYTAAVALGKVLRTIYLCDYLACPAFRKEILSLLNQGESLHTLQRALHHGPVGAKRGRRNEELIAISGALTLLTNIVMAFNTKRLQDQIDADPALDQPELLAHIAPHAVGHINLRGTFTFGLDRYHAQLFQAPIRQRVLNYRAENRES